MCVYYVGAYTTLRCVHIHVPEEEHRAVLQQGMLERVQEWVHTAHQVSVMNSVYHISYVPIIDTCTKVYLTSPGPSEIGHNSFTLLNQF